ncbi:hypothetical protein BCEN4_40056 [Burkholderia cenocepacia]|nr:hypothetical protein BCEN4_40056 [Burkholderia cenocepacia]
MSPLALHGLRGRRTIPPLPGGIVTVFRRTNRSGAETGDASREGLAGYGLVARATGRMPFET